ncbi:MAG: GIY-YIG nuclease family protein [Daejeonella sp.]
MNNYCVYILKCSDNSYYTGLTNDVEYRIYEHNLGENKKAYTFKRRPVYLVFINYFADINHAIEFEKQVKGWSRRKKEAIIAGNWDDLPEFSKCQNSTHFLNKHL